MSRYWQSPYMPKWYSYQHSHGHYNYLKCLQKPGLCWTMLSVPTTNKISSLGVIWPTMCSNFIPDPHYVTELLVVFFFVHPHGELEIIYVQHCIHFLWTSSHFTSLFSSAISNTEFHMNFLPTPISSLQVAAYNYRKRNFISPTFSLRYNRGINWPFSITTD